MISQVGLRALWNSLSCSFGHANSTLVVFCPELFLRKVCGLIVDVIINYRLWSPSSSSGWGQNFPFFISDSHYWSSETSLEPFYRIRKLKPKFHTVIKRQSVDLNPLTLMIFSLRCAMFRERLLSGLERVT